MTFFFKLRQLSRDAQPFNNLVQFGGFVSLYRRQLVYLLLLSVAELDELSRVGSLTWPPLPVVHLIEISEVQGVLEVDKAVAFVVDLRVGIHRHLEQLVHALVCLVNVKFELLVVPSLGNVSHHHIRPLIVSRHHSVKMYILIGKVVRLTARSRHGSSLHRLA